MPGDGAGLQSRDPAIVSVPEIRDYLQINRRLTQLLDAGVSQIRLVGVEKQRLLISGLKGIWAATIVVEGVAGPELGAQLDAPNLLVLASSAADGVGSRLKAGSLILSGEVGHCPGYAQQGGVILLAGAVAGRAGLEQQGGTLIISGRSGPLCGERQRGGSLVLLGEVEPRGFGYARSGGRRESPDGRIAGTTSISNESQMVVKYLSKVASAHLGSRPEIETQHSR